jgi:hypothetical protein
MEVQAQNEALSGKFYFARFLHKFVFFLDSVHPTKACSMTGMVEVLIRVGVLREMPVE